MALGGTTETYKEIILFLATAGIAVPIFHQLRLSPVLGFIAAGALIGPFGLGRFTGQAPWLSWFTISNRENFAHLAEFGVVFLLFMIGLELSWERLRRLRRLVFGLGSLQVGLSAAALCLAAMILGLDAPAAIIVGIALALSSTAIVVPILAARKRLNSPAGRTSFSILLFQDLAVAPILFTIAALGTAAGGSLAANLLFALGQAAIAIVAILLAGRLALRPLFETVASTRNPEMFMAACLLVVVATALVAAASGLSMALGAFVAGLLLAETEYRRAVEAMIEPFKGLLLGVFFVSIGMDLDLSRLAEQPVLLLAAAAGIIAIKAGIIFALSFVFRLGPRIGLETGLLLGAGGEFAFVIIAAGIAARLLPDEVGQSALIVATLSMVAIPFLARMAVGLKRRLTPPPPAPAVPEAPQAGKVIIAGYGRVGRLVGEMLTRHAVPFVAVDNNATLVSARHGGEQTVYFGDSSSPEFLRACGIETARAFVVTLDSADAVEAAVAAARSFRPDLQIVARARDAKHATALYRLGVTDAVPETIEASLQLSEAVLVDIGVPMGKVIASIHERRDEFRKVLKSTTDSIENANTPAFLGRRSPSKPVRRKTDIPAETG